MGRHKQVVCQKCCRVMRSDNLKKHVKVHEQYNENSHGKPVYAFGTSAYTFSPITKYCVVP